MKIKYLMKYKNIYLNNYNKIKIMFNKIIQITIILEIF